MGDNLSYEERTERAQRFVEALEMGTEVMLVAEPENPMDDNAIIEKFISLAEFVGIKKERTDQIIRDVYKGKISTQFDWYDWRKEQDTAADGRWCIRQRNQGL